MHTQKNRDEITPKSTKISHSQNVKRRNFVGYGGERAAIWAIYNLCGVPVRTRAASKMNKMVTRVRTN
jgi:hypothetical protein